MKPTTKKFKTTEEYIATFPKDIQTILTKVRKTIKQVAPKAEEAISYDIPTFKLNGKYLIYFAGWKNHISLYPVPYGTPAFNKELSQYIAGKGTIQFLLKDPIPYDLVKKVVEFRMKEVLGKQK